MKRQLMSLVLAGLLITTAGCSGLLNNGQGTPGSTETATTEVTAEMVPGVNESGVTNATKLVKAHSSQLNNTAHRAEMTVDETFTGFSTTNSTLSTDGPIESLEIVDVREPAANESHLEVRTKETHSEEVIGVWKRGEYVTYRQVKKDVGGESYGRTRGGFLAEFFTGLGQRISEAYLALTATRTLEPAGSTTMNGEGVLKLTGDVKQEELENMSASEGTITMYVSADGLIHEATMTLSDGEKTGKAAYTLTNPESADAQRPQWMENVPAVTGELTANGKVLALHHGGGAEIPEGATLSGAVSRADSSDRVEKELPKMAEGDTVYLYGEKTDTGVTYQLTSSEPSVTEEMVQLSDQDVQISIRVDKPVSISLTF